MDEKEEVNIKKMAVLLRQGATMLDLSCPQCGNILFRLKNGKINCPSCEREIIIQKKSYYTTEDQINITTELFSSKDKKKNKFSEELALIRKIIRKICKNLENLEQLSLLDIQLQILERLINLYKSFLSLN